MLEKSCQVTSGIRITTIRSQARSTRRPPATRPQRRKTHSAVTGPQERSRVFSFEEATEALSRLDRGQRFGKFAIGFTPQERSGLALSQCCPALPGSASRPSFENS